MGGSKWYLNAKNYSNESAEEYNLKEFLTEQNMKDLRMVSKTRKVSPVYIVLRGKLCWRFR